MKNSWCILLVEDDPVLGPLTHEALILLGHEAVLVSTAQGAYEHLSRHHEFHIVILDLDLGNERSEPVIERLVTNGWIVPPILIFSAQPLSELLKAQRRVGAKGVISKPTTMKEINTAVDMAIAECTV